MWKIAHNWHRKVGLVAAFFVILLVITGILLNHTDSLDLRNRFVDNDLLLDWYQITPKGKVSSYIVDRHWVTQIDKHLYFDRIEVADNIDNLFGAVSISDGYVVALDGRLLILTLSGEVVERISATDGIPGGINAIGLSEEREVVISAEQGNFLADLDNLEWQIQDGMSVNWSVPDKIPEGLYDQLLTLFRGKGLPVERVILDLHSGRILGFAGVLLIDFMALLFLLLALSGVWVWYRRR